MARKAFLMKSRLWFIGVGAVSGVVLMLAYRLSLTFDT